MNEGPPNFFDTDGRPEPAAAASLAADHKLKVWAVLNAIEQGLVTAEEACQAYDLSAAELEAHRTGWRAFEAGNR